MITTTQWSRRAVLTVALALGVAGCGSAGPEPSNNERSGMPTTSGERAAADDPVAEAFNPIQGRADVQTWLRAAGLLD